MLTKLVFSLFFFWVNVDIIFKQSLMPQMPGYRMSTYALNVLISVKNSTIISEKIS